MLLYVMRFNTLYLSASGNVSPFKREADELNAVPLDGPCHGLLNKLVVGARVAVDGRSNALAKVGAETKTKTTGVGEFVDEVL